MSQMNTVQNIPDASDKPFDPSTNLRKRFTSKKKKKKPATAILHKMLWQRLRELRNIFRCIAKWHKDKLDPVFHAVELLYNSLGKNMLIW